MIIEGHNLNKKVFIVAEIGNNHEGNFELALKMIDEAYSSGVDAVKFQTFIPELFISKDEKDRLEKLRSFQFSFDQFYKLFKYAKKKGLVFFSTPLDLESAKYLNQFQSVFKIASSDNNFLQLIDLVSDFDKNLILSTGLSDEKEIDEIYNRIFYNWGKKVNSNKLSLLHCVSSYPVPDNEANLAKIKYLKDRYKKAVIGYSDHTIGIDCCIYAALLGARIIEKHFTIDKNYSDFRDHQLSADPNEMKLLVNKIRKTEIVLGEENNFNQKCELENKILLRRSIAASRDLNIGQIINSEDLLWVRPGNGFQSGEEYFLTGKRIKHSLKKGQIITEEDLC
tara:strand:+ start:1472 stop:2485 length:1014 start_codon:yes stop_codon:yes gene_type:complete